jgi:ribosomal RNA-processing protein 8
MAVQKRSKPADRGGKHVAKKGRNFPQTKRSTLGRKDSPSGGGPKHRRSPTTSTTTSGRVSSPGALAKNKNKATKNQQRMDTGMQQQEKDPKKPRDGEIWSKSKKKRMRALKAKQKRPAGLTSTTDPSPVAAAVAPTKQSLRRAGGAPNDGADESKRRTNEQQDEHHDDTGNKTNKNSGADTTTSTAGLSKLQKTFRDRLSGSRFRILNEELYTTLSTEALQRFQDNPHLFDEYHEGFRQQVSHWPVNPVSILVQKIQDHHASFAAAKSSSSSSSSTQSKSLVVADFGCGDADLARQLLSPSTKQKPPATKMTCVVHSFDLVARGPNAELITACDSAHTPLQNSTVDIGVFCLSLMGTNLADFIREAHRVLKENGILHIAEVRSRFEEGGNDAEDTSLQHFIKTLDKLGFECAQIDRSNTMFVLMDLRKNGKQPNQTLSYTAKPCIYKRR